jgi:hypothetical protein
VCDRKGLQIATYLENVKIQLSWKHVKLVMWYKAVMGANFSSASCEDDEVLIAKRD